MIDQDMLSSGVLFFRVSTSQMLNNGLHDVTMKTQFYSSNWCLDQQALCACFCEDTIYAVIGKARGHAP